MLDRKKAPSVKEVYNLKLPTPIAYHLDNGIPVFETRMGEQEILKVEILFYAGRPVEQKDLAARATSSLLKEGTKNYSAAQIAEKIDFYGGTLSVPINLDYTSVVLYSLTKHFEKLLILLAEMVTQPTFPQDELEAFAERNIQQLAVDLARSEVVAYRKITELIYGENHPYGYNSSEKLYRNLTQKDLKEHFAANYHAGNCRIFISGKTSQAHIALLNKYLGQSIPAGVYKEPKLSEQFASPQKVTIAQSESLQTAIRIGRRLFNRQHPDFNGMYVLNTVLGGYFGSRLMANVREDKGYTYNIFSSLDPMMYDGYFYIGTEVGNEFTEKALKEIYREIEILQNDLVEEDELKMVKNYLSGNVLTTLDGAFNVADVIKTYVAEGLSVETFYELTDEIRNISPQRIRDLAQKYLDKKDMWEVLVG